MQSTDPAVINVDENGIVRSYSRSAALLLGWPRNRVIGCPVTRILPELALETARAVGETEWVPTEDTHACCRDGSHIRVAVRAHTWQCADTRLITLLIRPARGNTPKHSTAIELGEQEAQASLWGILQAAVDGIIIIDAHGCILTVSAGAERMFGYSSSEITGQNINLLMPEPDCSRHDSYLRAYLSGGPARVIGAGREVTGKRRDGTTFPMDLSVGEIGKGKRRRFVGICRDISQRKKTENLLRQREEQLRLTFENAPVAMGTCDPTGHFISVNPALCNMLCYSAQELRTMSFAEIAHPDDVERNRAMIEKLFAGELSCFSVQERCLRRDGSVMHGILHCGAIHDAQGNAIMLIAQVEDLTDRLRMEEEARQHRERLAHVTRLSALGEMAAGIAHEVNQPLTAIATYAQACSRMVAAHGRSDSRLPDALEKVTVQAQRAGEIIRRLRDLVKKRVSDRELVSMDDVVCGAIRLGEVDARVHDTRIEVITSGQQPAATVDPVQIQQVILNLIRNGIEAMDGVCPADRKITVTVTDIDGEFSQISVTDRGSGLEESNAERLFGPFYTTKPSGMGMGLSISRSIVTAHGGRMWFSRNAGAGATFHFTLPLTPTPGEPEEPQA